MLYPWESLSLFDPPAVSAVTVGVGATERVAAYDPQRVVLILQSDAAGVTRLRPSTGAPGTGLLTGGVGVTDVNQVITLTHQLHGALTQQEWACQNVGGFAVQIQVIELRLARRHVNEIRDILSPGRYGIDPTDR